MFFAKKAWLFAVVAAVLSTLGGALGHVAQSGDGAIDWKVTLSGVLTAAVVALGQVLTPSAYNKQLATGGSFEQLSFAKRKSFSLGGLLNGALTAGAQIAAGGGLKQAVPIILTSVLAAATGGTAYLNQPDAPRPRDRDTLRWPPV